jgi:hypothetical protein
MLIAIATVIGGAINLNQTAATDLTTASTPVSPSPIGSSSVPPPATGNTASEDRAVCTAIAPLMADNDKFSNAYIDLGDAGTPARDAALPKFISDTQNWVAKVQPIIDQHPAASPYLTRTLQRYLDDQTLMVSDMTPGPMTSYEESLWADSLGAYSGPIHVCDKVGVRW